MSDRTIGPLLQPRPTCYDGDYLIVSLRSLYPSRGFEWPTRIPVTTETNTHLSSFGMGKLFVQGVSARLIANHVHDYRTSSEAADYIDFGRCQAAFGFPRGGSRKFPNKSILDHDGADRIADEVSPTAWHPYVAT